MAPAIGSRQLTVLREFRPHGLAAEEADGGGPEARPLQDYDYFLFDPSVAASPAPAPEDEAASSSVADGDHELFIRGNRIIWSTGSRVHKRYASPNTVIMACWCRMEALSDALLCVLQVDTLSIYDVTGEVVSIPLPYAVSSIWSLPFGILLQKSSDGGRMVSSSSSLLNARDLTRPNKEFGLNYNVACQAQTPESANKSDGTIISSHLILKHPLEVPQATYFEERSRLSMMKDFDEKTIWTSDRIPLMASYHKGKFQHSVWQVDGATYQEAMDDNAMLSIPRDISQHKFAFLSFFSYVLLCDICMKQHKVCGGATPPCCYNVYSTSVEGTASTCCARYRSRGECRLIGQQEFNPELLGHKIYSKILDKNNKFYYR
uniref:Anaphase-promoting complex subunit 1 n=1 Tax=Aegilops tauschii TaxID=37682 RepID=N1QY93_AEGTA